MMQLFGRLRWLLVRWHERRIADLALARLDDRMLRDIGLTRDLLSASSHDELARPVTDGAARRPVPANDLPASDAPANDDEDGKSAGQAA